MNRDSSLQELGRTKRSTDMWYTPSSSSIHHMLEPATFLARRSRALK